MTKRTILRMALLGAVLIILALNAGKWVAQVAVRTLATPDSSALKLIERPRTVADKIVNGAKGEAIRGVRYDPAYLSIPYPNGDVPADRGACTDVLIRALRNAGFDLQKLIHEDMTRHFTRYPKKWGLRAPDSNIDHRRVPNHLVFMQAYAKALPKTTGNPSLKSWQPGDLVYWDLTGNGLTHCGVISNEPGPRGPPLVIHNIGPVASQEDCLDRWKILGHFRYPVGREAP